MSSQHDPSLSELWQSMLDKGFPLPTPKSTASKRDASTEAVLSGFKEVEAWVDEHDGQEPASTDKSPLKERELAASLDCIRSNPNLVDFILKCGNDRHGLLNDYVCADTTSADPTSTNSQDDSEIGRPGNGEPRKIDAEALVSKLNDLGYEQPESITTLRYVRSAEERQRAGDLGRSRPDRIAERKRCEDFEMFSPVFADARKGLKNNSLVSMDLAGKTDIVVHGLYVLSGYIAYVADAENPFTKSGKKDARLRVIFDNGTESDMLKTSFLTAMAKNPDNRAIVPNKTGVLYVLRSLSEDPYISENRDMVHKIGFTKNSVDARLSTARWHPTYLMADVEVKKSYDTFRVNPRNFEKLFHAFFAHTRLDIEVVDRFGKVARPKEWFEVPVQAIDDFVKKFRKHGADIVNYRYNIETARIEKIR